MVGNLVILHVGEPELAARESLRVLAPDGLAAFSTWDAPERSPIFAAIFAVADAASNHGRRPRRALVLRFAEDDGSRDSSPGPDSQRDDRRRPHRGTTSAASMICSTALFEGTVRVGGMLPAGER